jgi:DNA polymerase sigma
LLHDLSTNCDLLLLNFLHFYSVKFDSKSYGIRFHGSQLLNVSDSQEKEYQSLRKYQAKVGTATYPSVSPMSEPFFKDLKKGGGLSGKHRGADRTMYLEDPFSTGNNVTSALRHWDRIQLKFQALFQSLVYQLGIMYVPNLKWENINWIEKEEILDLAKPHWLPLHQSYLKETLAFTDNMHDLRQFYKLYCQKHKLPDNEANEDEDLKGGL